MRFITLFILLFCASFSVYSVDKYLFEDTVEISETIEGNIYVFASTLTISGRVKGDVYFSSGEVNITGVIEGEARGIAAQIVIDGTVEEDCVFLCASYSSTENSRLQGRNFIISGNISADGYYAEKNTFYSSFVRLGGFFKELNVHAGKIIVNEDLEIQNTLQYWSNEKVEISSRSIRNKVIFHPSFLSRVQSSMLKTIKLSSVIITTLMNFFYSLVIGLVLYKYFRKKIESSSNAIQKYPIRCLVNGIVVMIGLPLLAIALLITIVGVPFALTLLAVNVIGFYTAKILFVFWFGTRLKLLEKHPCYKFTICLAGYFIIRIIPVVGTLLTFAATIYGLGSLVTSNRSDLVFLERH